MTIDLPGYQTIEKFYESSRSKIYRAMRSVDLLPVILKLFDRASRSPQDLDRFQLEYDILRSLNLEGVVTAYALETYRESSIIILEDFGGKSLQMWLNDRTFNLAEFLSLAIKLTLTLGEIHQHNIIHKDINPSNIVFNPTTGQVKIVDFGLATIRSPENTQVNDPNLLEGTLAYISPEQTGRMNRSIDYRTDFYSLGVTFYQLLCNRLPFETTDPLELVHAHLARQPIPPDRIDSSIPRPLSDLVIKLMAKNPEDRYRTTHEIFTDLQACLALMDDRTDSIDEPKSTLTVTASYLVTTTSTTGTAALDLAALMKASQALAGEIVLDKLLAKLMKISIENSGAQRGCLFLDNGGELEIAAIMEPDRVSILLGTSIDRLAMNDVCSIEIVNYVASSKESIVLDRATEDPRFSQDTYIRDRQPKSILCTPLIYQGKRAGILYLENNLTTDAFTPQRLEFIQFLSVQAAISIDNAQLYDRLELRVRQRTLELTQTNERLELEILERQKSEQILRSIVAGTVSATGVDFFRSLVRSLADALDVRYAFISECMDTPPTRVRSFAFWQGKEFGDEFEYDLYGTPCELVIGSNSYRCFPAQIQALFPVEKDELAAMSAQSYAGIPLITSTGNMLGHLAVLDDKEMDSSDRDRAIMEIFAARAVAEMERLQVEDALRGSEMKFSTAFRSSPNAIAITTLLDGNYIEINETCLQVLGYSRDEMLGSSALELGIWANPADRIAIADRIQQSGRVSNLEIWFHRKSGEIFPTLLSAEVIYLENEPCLLLVATDITILKQAEKALARLAEIGELAATIVHEVRNPLTTILMGLNAFKKLQLTERFQEYLALSLDEADRLQRLLSQILLYSKPQILDRAELELNSFILETLNTLQTIPAALEKHLEFISIEPIYVLVDRDKFKQVIINLITNACEAVNTGDVITTKVTLLDDRHVCVKIHNGGTPIPADILPRLTQPFFTTKASGTGLGLAIVKRIIEAHDGEFKIESGEELGSIVTVRLAIMLS